MPKTLPELLHPDSDRSLREAAVANVVPPPQEPGKSLASRRGHDVWGDAILFKITDECFREIIKIALGRLNQLCRESFNLPVGSFWQTKDQRRREKHFKVQREEALHLAFAQTRTPCVLEDFLATRHQQTDLQWAALNDALQAYLNQTNGPSFCFAEIKMNPDGHIVLRMTIQNAVEHDKLLRAIKEIFPSEERYAGDANKVFTLAMVLGVCDLSVLSNTKQQVFREKLSEIFKEVAQVLGSLAYPFHEIQVQEWHNRMLRDTGIIGQMVLRR